MGRTMLSEYEASILSSEDVVTRTGKSVDLFVAARRAAIWIAGITAIVLMAPSPSDQVSFEKTAVTGPSKHFPASGAPPDVNALDVAWPSDGDPATNIVFGFVEFDWDPKAPGGVYGFGPLPPSTRPLARIETDR